MTHRIPEPDDDGCFGHSDIRILNVVEISDFVLWIYCSPRPTMALGRLTRRHRPRVGTTHARWAPA